MGPAGNPAPTPHILPAPPGPAGSPQRAGPQRREGGQPGVHCQPAPRRRSRLARGRQRHAPVAAGSGQRGRHHLDQQRGPRAGRGREEVTSMTDTPAIPAPIANGSTPSLNKALAAVQAEIPPVAKGQTAKVDGTTKDGRPVSYSYDYADLADCSQAILPLLGRNRLAFSCRPDLIHGK